MRLTANARNSFRGMGVVQPAANTVSGASIPSPIGGWDASSPLASMPPQNAVELVNWFPQPGYVELRRGFLIHCDTGEAAPVETVMGYQGIAVANNALFAATNGKIIDITASTPSVVDTGFLSDRWQYQLFSGTGGMFLMLVNGEDTPVYWDGSALQTTAITGSGFAPEDFIHVASYRQRLWFTVKNTTKAVYLGVDAISGTGTVFDVGNVFKRGGYLQAIGTWSTSANDGPEEFICFVSSYGDVAIYNISNPGTADGINYVGTAQLGAPIGRRCLTRFGSDLALITIDGVVLLSRTVSYDKSVISGTALTNMIRQAMTEAAQRQSDLFGWQYIAYPRSNMAILNVPVAENLLQDQFVMNTLTGAWCRFTGQNGNCWEIFENRAYFGGNDGVVFLADESAGDQDQVLSADMRGAFNYYQSRGMQKRWTMLRPLITINYAFPVEPFIGINVDFGELGTLDPVPFGSGAVIPLWDDPSTAIWDESIWPGDVDEANWVSVQGIGYCASIRMTVDIPWTPELVAPRTLRVNSFDVLNVPGGFI